MGSSKNNSEKQSTGTYLYENFSSTTYYRSLQEAEIRGKTGFFNT